jgi:hypothetical protein
VKLGRTEEEFWFKATPAKVFTLIDKYIEELEIKNGKRKIEPVEGFIDDIEGF